MNRLLSFLGLNPLSQLKKASKAYVKSSRAINKHAGNAAAEIDQRINNLDVARSAALDVKSFVLDLDKVANATTVGLDKIVTLM